jgi:hypothetical protein
MRKVPQKDWRNKVFNLRSQSVAKQIETRKNDEILESQKLNHNFAKSRRDSFSHKKVYKFPSPNKKTAGNSNYSDYSIPFN